jgi:predicted RND superfamily exporter protein
MSYVLPYNINNIDLIPEGSSIKVTGKALNLIPNKMLENDIYIINSIDKYLGDVEDLAGENDNGIIDHINYFIKNETSFKTKYNEKLDLFKIFLEKNSAIQNADEFLTCIKYDKCEDLSDKYKYNKNKNIYANYNNIQLDYYTRKDESIRRVLDGVCCGVNEVPDYEISDEDYW